VKGPASVRFGPGAMGGVIHVEQPPLRWDSIAGAASTNLFLNNVQGALAAWADVPEPFGLPIAIRGEGSVRRAGDMRAPGYALDNTGFSQISGAATVQYGKVPSEPSLKATVSLFNSTIGIFTAAHTGNADDLQRAIASDAPLVAAGDRYSIESPRQEVNHVTLVADGTLPFQSAGELTLRYGYQQNFRNEYDLHNTRIVGQGTDSAERAADSMARLEASLAAPALSLLLSTYNLDAEFAHHPIGPLAGSIGISGLRQANSRGGSVSLIPDYVQWGAAGFINENWLMETIAISAGLRYDARWLDAWPDGVRGDAATLQQRFFGSLSGGLGMRWQSTDELKLSANLGLAWRPPNVNELYSNGVHHGAARYEIGDSTLGSEHMTGLDVNAEVRTSAVSLTASAYANFFDGYIQPLPDPEHPTITVRGTFPTFLYKQTQALIAGVDLDAHVYASEVLELMAQGAVVYGEDRTHEQPLFQMPASRLRVAAHAHGHDVLGLESVYAEVGVLGVATQGRYVPEQDYAPPPPGYVICDLQIGGSLLLGTRHARWSVGCTNLFNTAYRDYLSRYRYYADDAGFDLVLRFTYLLGQQP
jgi:iron complex outermembrane receptor protein